MSITEPSRLDIALTLLTSRLGRWSRYPEFVDGLGLKGSEKVLDFGSGWGDETYYIAHRLNDGGRVTALDVSKQWQEVARRRLKKFSNVDFVNADIRSSGLPDESFDVIVIDHVLHDIPAEERQATVEALAKKLRPGGFIELREPIGKRHGMNGEQVRPLMSNAGLKEASSTTKKKEFRGRYAR